MENAKIEVTTFPKAANKKETVELSKKEFLDQLESFLAKDTDSEQIEDEVEQNVKEPLDTQKLEEQKNESDFIYPFHVVNLTQINKPTIAKDTRLSVMKQISEKTLHNKQEVEDIVNKEILTSKENKLMEQQLELQVKNSVSRLSENERKQVFSTIRDILPKDGKKILNKEVDEYLKKYILETIPSETLIDFDEVLETEPIEELVLEKLNTFGQAELGMTSSPEVKTNQSIEAVDVKKTTGSETTETDLQKFISNLVEDGETEVISKTLVNIIVSEKIELFPQEIQEIIGELAIGRKSKESLGRVEKDSELSIDNFRDKNIELPKETTVLMNQLEDMTNKRTETSAEEKRTLISIENPEEKPEEIHDLSRRTALTSEVEVNLLQKSSSQVRMNHGTNYSEKTVSQSDFSSEIEQLVIEETVGANLEDKITTTRIQLSPEHLGKVDLHLEMTDKELTAKLLVEKEETKEWIEQQVVHLKEKLLYQEITIKDFQVVVHKETLNETFMNNEENPFFKQKEKDSQAKKEQRVFKNKETELPIQLKDSSYSTRNGISILV